MVTLYGKYFQYKPHIPVIMASDEQIFLMKSLYVCNSGNIHNVNPIQILIKVNIHKK